MSRAARQDGFTVVEALVAALILVIGGIAVLTAVDTAARGTYRAEQSQVVINRLQDEVERIRQLPFDDVALDALPTHSTDPDSPASRVVGTTYALNDDGSNARPMAYEGGPLTGGGTIANGAVAAAPTPFNSGDVSGDIYRYVVWVNDSTCPDSICPGQQDKKRIVVAALLDETASGGLRAYQEVQGDLVDPDVQRVSNELPPGEDDDPAWQFWLTDTPCNNATRQPITGDHATHNSLGSCSAGLRTGNTPGSTAGAPDLMFTEAPPLDPNFPPDDQPLYDYASNVEPASNPDQDKGLQMYVPSSGTGCMPFNLSGSETTQQLRMHRWLSPPIPNGYDVVLDGRGTLSLWTQTVSDANHPGRICAWLFTRVLNSSGQPVDTKVVNLDNTSIDHFEYQDSAWASGDWAEIELPLHFAAATDGSAVHLVPGTRLGLAVGIHRGGTLPGDGLQFNYDTPSFDSRLELDTGSVLPIFE